LPWLGNARLRQQIDRRLAVEYDPIGRLRQQIASRWCDRFWSEYTSGSGIIGPLVQLCNDLNGKKAYDPAVTPPDPVARTEDEERQFQNLRWGLVAGSCIGGYWLPDRTPGALWIVFDPLAGKPSPQAMDMLTYRFWGAPNPIKRLIFGADDDLKAGILSSGNWKGTDADLDAILIQQQFSHNLLPIRDAIDFVHACIYSTTKAMKFSNLFQVVGGPIEIAVVTSDRKFRWVRHKDWDAAIAEG
jgi:hypothetical protein